MPAGRQLRAERGAEESARRLLRGARRLFDRGPVQDAAERSLAARHRSQCATRAGWLRTKLRGAGGSMFVAMNRFKVVKGSEEAFEAVWKNRNSTLSGMKGFRDFHLLRGPLNEAEGYTLFASHTLWASEADFIAWTKSENFRAAHRGAGENKPLYVGH